MRSLVTKTAAALVAVVVAFGFLATPIADAQGYAPLPPGDVVPIEETLAVIAAQQPGNGPSLTVDGTTITVTLSESLAGIGTNVKVTGCSTCKTLFDGKIPASGVLTLDAAALGAGTHAIKITTTLPSGRTVLQTLSATIGAISTPSVPLPKLAFTGSTVNLPLALGSVMVGAGGLIVLAARKRERHAA